jgi:hypothetical protein
MKVNYATGGNYSLDIVDGVVLCHVRKRPDVSREEGAAFAVEMGRHFATLASGSRVFAFACILNLRDAPPVWGPATQAALEYMVRVWEVAARRVALVTSSEEAIQQLQCKRIATMQAPSHSKVFTSLEGAEAWVRETRSARRSLEKPSR